MSFRVSELSMFYFCFFSVVARCVVYLTFTAQTLAESLGSVLGHQTGNFVSTVFFYVSLCSVFAQFFGMHARFYDLVFLVMKCNFLLEGASPVVVLANLN